MAVMNPNDDPSRSGFDSTHLTQLLLHTFQRSPALPTYSQDAGPGVKIHLPNTLGTFLVSVIQQQWQQDPESTTVIPRTTGKRSSYSWDIHCLRRISYFISERISKSLTFSPGYIWVKI